MTDALLTSNDQQEALSRAYVAAIAARAGYTTAVSDFDRDGIDLIIQAGGQVRPSLAIQLKATINLGSPSGGVYRFPLKRRNYDLLICPTMVPRILVVFDMPDEQPDWMSITADNLILRRCAYWANLRGAPETSNTTSVTVPIPCANQFDVDCVKGLMEQARTGSIA